MSHKSSFANLRASAPPPATELAEAQTGKGPASRHGRSLQALMAEAFNDVLRKHGESPVGDWAQFGYRLATPRIATIGLG